MICCEQSVVFFCLMDSARLVVADSGGIQDESTILKVPCVTLRDNTERPVTCQMGTNHLAGTDPNRVMKVVDEVLATPAVAGRIPPLWDGRAAERIVEVICREEGGGGSQNVECGM